MAKGNAVSGNINNVILKLLYEGDNFANDIIKQINGMGGGEVKQADVYASLKYLEKKKLTSSYWDESDGKRKYYTLTKTGKDAYLTYKNEVERSKDLFGDLINDGTILPADDFTDVEDDEYKIPKRPSVRAPRKNEHKNVVVEYTPPQFSSEFNHKTDEPAVEEKPQENASPAVSESSSQPEPQSATTEENKNDAIVLDEDEGKNEQNENDTVTERVTETTTQATSHYERPQDIIDPHQRLQEIYSSSFVANRSYSDAPRQKEAPQLEPKKAELPEVVKEPLPAERKESAPQVQQPRAVQEQESLAKREYKSILNDLVDSCEVQVKNQKQEQVQEQPASDTDTTQSTEFGDNIQIRSHNDSAKVYNHKYYYYSNRLLMTHYTIMCALMFVIGLTLFFTFFFGLNMRMKYDYLLYIFIGLLPIIMFMVAVIIYAAEPNKKKRINVNFRFSIMIRIVIMIQVLVVIYCINLIWGMPVSFSLSYLPSLVIPGTYALFVPMSELIYMNLLNSERYAVE